MSQRKYYAKHMLKIRQSVKSVRQKTTTQTIDIDYSTRWNVCASNDSVCMLFVFVSVSMFFPIFLLLLLRIIAHLCVVSLLHKVQHAGDDPIPPPSTPTTSHSTFFEVPFWHVPNGLQYGLLNRNKIQKYTQVLHEKSILLKIVVSANEFSSRDN